MGELVSKEDPGKAFEKGKIEAKNVGLCARGHSSIRGWHGHEGGNRA